MSGVVEVYDPKFDDLHGEPMVIWRENSGAAPRIALNLLEQYRRWRNDHKGFKHDLPPAFWQTNGPAIVRALGYCGAKALIFDWVTDRKVCYRWFMKKPVVGSGVDYYCVCSVSAEGGTLGADSHVDVELPNGESVHFSFMNRQMLDWVKPEPKIGEG